jgi:hypothetical protein
MSRFRKRGEVVVLRYLPIDRLRRAKPVRVVTDATDVMALYLAAGTTIKEADRPGHRASHRTGALRAPSDASRRRKRRACVRRGIVS